MVWAGWCKTFWQSIKSTCKLLHGKVVPLRCFTFQMLHLICKGLNLCVHPLKSRKINYLEIQLVVHMFVCKYVKLSSNKSVLLVLSINMCLISWPTEPVSHILADLACVSYIGQLSNFCLMNIVNLHIQL